MRPDSLGECRGWEKFAPRKARRAPSDAPSNALSHEPLIARKGAKTQVRFEASPKNAKITTCWFLSNHFTPFVITRGSLSTLLWTHLQQCRQ